MKESINELERFFESENVNCYWHEEYKETLVFRSYGERYNIICKDDGTFAFCCQSYPNVQLLIEAINNRCRGGDGKIA